jgi:hypothetical protein
MRKAHALNQFIVQADTNSITPKKAILGNVISMISNTLTNKDLSANANLFFFVFIIS